MFLDQFKKGFFFFISIAKEIYGPFIIAMFLSTYSSTVIVRAKSVFFSVFLHSQKKQSKIMGVYQAMSRCGLKQCPRSKHTLDTDCS